MKKWHKYLLVSITLLVLVLSSAWFWINRSESGLRWLLTFAESERQPLITIDGVKGSLADGFKIRQTIYSDSGTVVTVNQLGAEIEYSLIPIYVKLAKLNIGLLEITQNDTNTNNSEPLEDLSLPLEIEITSLQIDKLLYSDKQNQIEANNLQLSLSAGQRLKLLNLESDISYSSSTGEAAMVSAGITLSGGLELRSPWRHNFDLQLGVNSVTAPDNLFFQKLLSTQFNLNVSGDVKHSKVNINASGELAFKLQAQLDEITTNPQWQAQLQSEALSLPLDSGNAIYFNAIDVSSSGDMTDWEVNGNSQIKVSGSQIDAIGGQLNLLVDGTQQELSIKQLNLSGELGELNFNGQLQTDTKSGQGALSIEGFKAGYFIDQWPLTATTSLSSELDFSSTELKLSKLLAVIDNSDTSIGGEIEISQTNVNAKLDWRNLEWPVASGALAEYSSPLGALTANGTLDSYSLNGRLEFSGQQVPAGNLSLQGYGNRGGFVLESATSEVLNGKTTISGDFQWQPALAGSINIRGNSINPGKFWGDYQGDLDFGLQLDFQNDHLEIQLKQLSGELRQQAILANGKISYTDGEWEFDQLTAQSGATKLSLDGKGSLEDLLKARGVFDITVPDLSQWAPELSGELFAKGELRTTTNGDSKLQIEARGSNIKSPILEIAEFDLLGEATLPTSDKSIYLSGKLEGTQLKLSGFEEIIEVISLEATPLSAELGQAISIQAKSESYALTSNLALGVARSAGNLILSGEINSIDISSPITGPIALQAPSQFKFDGRNLQLSPTCLRQQPDSINVEICLSRKLDKQMIESSVVMENFPIAWVLAYLPVNLAAGQSLSGSVAWLEPVTLNPNSKNLANIGTVDLIINPGVISSVDLDAGYLETGTGWLKMQLNPGTAINSSAFLPLSGKDSLSLDFKVNGLANPQTAVVESNIDLNVTDLNSLKWLVPGLDQLSGAVGIQLQLFGTITAPNLTGSAKITNVGLFYTPLGLELSQLNLDGALESGQKSSLTGSFIAGTGKGQIALNINSGIEQAELSLVLSGNDLQFVNQPSLAISISPEIELNYSQGEFNITGEVNIPSARIKPLPGTTSSTPRSHDVVVSGLPETEETEHSPAVPMLGELKLTLGDDVKFKADGLAAEFTGALTLNFEKESSIPNATGEIQLVDGYFKQYGQNLKFENSNIHFDGKSVLEPILDVAAVRHIFGDTQVESAGVKVTGRPSNIQLKLFTDPPTNEETAAAYVATGSNFDHGSGVGALNVGTYLYPKLFVSYGLGLFDSGNIISVRYELTERWAVQGTSGEEGSGVDLLFSVDR